MHLGADLHGGGAGVHGRALRFGMRAREQILRLDRRGGSRRLSGLGGHTSLFGVERDPLLGGKSKRRWHAASRHRSQVAIAQRL